MLVADLSMRRRFLCRVIRRAAAPAATAILLASPQPLRPQRPLVNLAMYAFAVPPPTATATPSPIQAGVASEVTVEAQLNAPADRTYRLDVFRLDRTHDTETDLGPMTQTSPSGSHPRSYTARIRLDENVAGTVALQVRAHAQTAPALMAMTAAPSLNSAIVNIQVTSGPPNHGIENGGQGAANNGPGAVGTLLGGLLSGLLNNHGDATPPAGEPRETTLQAHGVEIRYPEGWTVDSKILSMGGPISLRNFAQFQQGAVVPPGGAEITVTRVVAASSMSAAVDRDLGQVPQTRDRVADLDAVRASYVEQYPNLTLQNVAVYVANGDALYKFFITFRQGEPAQQQFTATFNHLLSTVRFK